MKPRAKLHIVTDPAPSASDRLAEVVPELIAAEIMVAQLRTTMKRLGQDLARERRVAFIREEQIRNEFGR